MLLWRACLGYCSDWAVSGACLAVAVILIVVVAVVTMLMIDSVLMLSPHAGCDMRLDRDVADYKVIRCHT